MSAAIVTADCSLSILNRLGLDQFTQELDQPVLEPPRLLQTSSPRTPMRRASRRLIALLLVLCLVPRVWRAAQLDVPCPDGTFYIQVASLLEQGDYSAAFKLLPANTYPAVLAALHGLGLDYPLAGKIWGVALGTLTVLPILGWLRRQTGERVAIISALFYASHPTFIEWCPELVRDGTFWFLAAMVFYFAFRAVTEVRIAFYFATGLALTLAVHTRFEGWFLLLPILLWSFWRWLALNEQRGRLLIGLVVCLGVYPTILSGAQWIWPHKGFEYPWGSMHRVVYVQNWLRSLASKAEPVPALSAPPVVEKHSAVAEVSKSESPVSTRPAAALPQEAARHEEIGSPDRKRWSEVYPHYTADGAFELLPPTRALGMLFRTLYRGVDAAFGLCLLIGWWKWRYVWIRRDFLPLFMITVAVMLGMWIHLTQVYGSSSRYALPLALAAMPYPAVGLLMICRGSRWLIAWFSGRQARLAYAFVAAMLLVTSIGWADALTTREPGRERDAALGQWLKAEYGPNRRAAIAGHLNLVGYFAGWQGIHITFYEPGDQFARWLAEINPDLLVIHRKELLPRAMKVVIAEANSLGLQAVAEERFPAPCRSDEYIVLQRPRDRAARANSDNSKSTSMR